MSKMGTAIVAAITTFPALTVLAAPAQAASSAVSMPLLVDMHSCDFQKVNYAKHFGPGWAQPVAQISSDGHTATARVEIKDGTPNAQYVARLIPAPHAALGCEAGAPGIGTAAVSTDATGTGAATVQAPIGAGTTGVWVALELPAPHSQTPTEFYSPTFIASV